MLWISENEVGQLEICEEEAAVVRKVFDLYLAGASVVMIRKYLAAEGIKTAKGKDIWSKLAIEKCSQTKNISAMSGWQNRRGSVKEESKYPEDTY